MSAARGTSLGPRGSALGRRGRRRRRHVSVRDLIESEHDLTALKGCFWQRVVSTPQDRGMGVNLTAEDTTLYLDKRALSST